MAQLVIGGDHGMLPQPALGVAVGDADVVTAIDPAGGGTVAWPSLDKRGLPAVAVRQDLPSGAAQTAVVAGSYSGPVAQLAVGRADSGDATIAFRQGDAGRFQIVGMRVTVPPARFGVATPNDWVRPTHARVRWEPAPSAAGGIRYGVVVDGRLVARELTRRSYLPRPGVLGSGIRRVQVLASDLHGQQFLTAPVDLRVDARPPAASVEGRARGAKRRRAGGVLPRKVVVRVRDRHSGLRVGRTRVSFGDGSRAVRGRRAVAHSYRRTGRYTIVVRGRDRVGNGVVRRLTVRVR